MPVIHTAESDGQKLTHRTHTEVGIGYAVLHGKRAKYVREGLHRALGRQFEFPEYSGLGEKSDYDRAKQGYESEFNQRQQEHKDKLNQISGLEDLTPVWEKATWHTTRQLAEKAAKSSKYAQTKVVQVTKENK